jgi:hypothetical protein
LGRELLTISAVLMLLAGTGSCRSPEDPERSTEGKRPATAAPPSAVPSGTLEGIRLFLPGDGEMWVVGVPTATVQHIEIPELGPGDAPHRIVRRNGNLVAWGYETLVLDPDAPASADVLAPDSWIFIPSAAKDRVWVGILDPESPDTERALKAVREVTVQGEVTVPDIEPPDGRWPVAAVNDALVFHTGAGLLMWDPRTGKVVERLPNGFALAWAGNLLAWCEEQCGSLHITDFATGRDVVVPVPEGTFGFDESGGAFSPDGRLLAIPVRVEPDVVSSRRQLALVHVATGLATTADGTTVEPGYVFVDWAASGASVFITGGQRFEPRPLIEYPLDAGTARRLDVEVGEFYDMAAF